LVLIAPMADVIGRVRLRGREGGGALRRAGETALGGVDLHPPGLAPAAILVVRRLGEVGPLTPGSPRARAHWERALHRALADIAVGAARPADGRIAATADAVCFRDEAELLACLALDLARGQARERWWWQTAIPALPPGRSEALRALLCERARVAPAALFLLADWGAVADVLRALATPDTVTVLETLAAVHGLAAAVVTPSGERAGGTRDATSVEHPAGAGAPAPRAWNVTERLDATGAGGATVAPWTSLLPVAARTLRLDGARQCLLGVAVAVHRQPMHARSAAFAAEVSRWRWPSSAGTHRTDTGGPSPVTDARLTPGPAVTSDARMIGAEGTHAGEADRRRRPVDRGAVPGAVPLDLEPPSGHARRGEETSADRAAVAGASSARGHDAPPPAPAITGDGAAGTERWLPRDGGADQARVDPLAVIPPGLPAVAGDAEDRAHISSSTAAVAADGAGVSDSPATVASAGEPAEPSRPRENERAVFTALGGVLFLVNALPDLDHDLTGGVGAWAVLELIARGLLDAEAAAWTDDALWPVLAWLDGRAPGEAAVAGREGRRRLSGLAAGAEEALARAGDGREGPSKVSYLLQRRGRLYATATHVDLVLPLDGTSIAVRRAGLDLDPGWRADFGRVIQFHYE
jgi:hypothetical protein